jgi:predicted nucleic acid-binding protein
LSAYLLDTNIVSEIRKGPRSDAGVARWFADADRDTLFISVLSLGEIRRGIERIRRRDPKRSLALERWLFDLQEGFSERILPITAEICDQWGRISAPRPLPVADALLAATALVHELTLVTRNTAEIEDTGVPLLNPFGS